MKIAQMENELQTARDAFSVVVLQPNTVARNVVLAEHRNEIARLQKLIAKSQVAN